MQTLLLLFYAPTSVIEQGLDWLAAYEMRLDDLFAVRELHVGIPYTLRIDDNHRPVTALIEATRFVDANLLLEPTLGNLFAQSVANFYTALFWACFAGRANEYVFLEYFHVLDPKAPISYDTQL
jgi:hypothetical protein